MAHDAWQTRSEQKRDIDAVHSINAAAFDASEEAALVDALRGDSSWIDGLSMLAVTEEDELISHALLTRCHIGETEALCLAPCAVLPTYQGKGVGTSVIEALLHHARALGELFVVVLGHPTYYPRFGFDQASSHDIRLSIDVPDEALMVLTLDPHQAPQAEPCDTQPRSTFKPHQRREAQALE